MKILFIPDVTATNPYQALLAGALSDLGAEVVFGRVLGPFSLTRCMLVHRDVSIVHLIWTHPFFIRGSRLISAAMLSLFIVDVLIARVLGAKIVWTVHNRWNHENRHVWLDLLNSRLLARLCDAMKVECQSAALEVERLYHADASKIAVIPEGNYLQAYPNTVGVREARKTVGIEPDKLLFLYFGLIRPYKGVFELVKAFEQMDQPRLDLLVAGRPLNQTIRLRLQEISDANPNIHMQLDFIAQDQVQIYMNASDVVVLPYEDILTSGTVLLAMSFGKAMILPRLGCVEEVVDNQGAFLYDPSAEAGLLNAMRQALDADLPAMGRRNLERVRLHNWPDIARMTYGLYERCMT